jgi:hypothetical protein
MVLATKLSTNAFAKFWKSCLLKEVTDYTYQESVTRLQLLFTKQRSIFADRYECLHLTRREGEPPDTTKAFNITTIGDRTQFYR